MLAIRDFREAMRGCVRWSGHPGVHGCMLNKLLNPAEGTLCIVSERQNPLSGKCTGMSDAMPPPQQCCFFV